MAGTTSSPSPLINAAQRAAETDAFLAAAGWGAARRQPFPQDTSVRKYTRLFLNGKTAIFMDAWPTKENTRGDAHTPLEKVGDYIFMRGKLGRLGLSVPEIYAAEEARGLMLIEDFGDDRYIDLVPAGADITALYRTAVDVLVTINRADPAIALEDSVPYSDDYWLLRVGHFHRYYARNVLKTEFPAEAIAAYESIWCDLLAQTHTLPAVLQHGDFVSQNLMWLPQRSGVRRCGLLDFQDMTDGRGNSKSSPAFDLVFLLQDVRLDLSADMEADMKKIFLAAVPYDRDAFDREYHILGAAQAVKCLGLFTRMVFESNDPHYKPFLRYCWRNVARCFAHPALAPLTKWFDAHVPDHARIGL